MLEGIPKQIASFVDASGSESVRSYTSYFNCLNTSFILKLLPF